MRFILLICSCFIMSVSFCQKFSSDKDKFTKELIKNIPQESFHKYVKKEFSPFLMNSGLNSSEFQTLVNRCNFLFKNDFLPEAIISIVRISLDQKKNTFPASFVSKWNELYNEKESSKDKSELKEFMTFSQSLFFENAFLIADNHKIRIEKRS